MLKNKYGNILIPVIGIILALSILATSVFTYTLNANGIIYKKNKNSEFMDARHILYISSSYFKDSLNEDSTKDSEYKEELEKTFDGLIITKTKNTANTLYRLYYPYNYNDDGTVKDYLMTKVILTGLSDSFENSSGDGQMNSTLFSEEAKIDEKFNIGNMASLYLTEKGYFPERAYQTDEISLVETDIDTFDEMTSFASRTGVLQVDNLVFAKWNTSSRCLVQDDDGNYDIFYETGDLGGNYYWTDSELKTDPQTQKKYYITNSYKAHIYRQEFDLQLLCETLNHTLSNSGKSVLEVDEYFYYELNDYHYIDYTYLQGNTLKKDTYKCDSKKLAELISNYLIFNNGEITFVKKTISGSKLTSGDIYDNLTLKEQNNCKELKLPDKYSNLSTPSNYRNWTYQLSWIDDTLKITTKFEYKIGNRWYQYTKNSMYNISTLSNILVNELKYEITIDTNEIENVLGYKFYPNTTFEEILGGTGAMEKLSGYKEVSIVNYLIREEIENNSSKFNAPVTYLQIRTVSLQSENDQLYIGGKESSFLRYQITFWYSLSENYDINNLQQHTFNQAFKILSYNPTEGALGTETNDKVIFTPVFLKSATTGNLDTILKSVAPISCTEYINRNFEEKYGENLISTNNEYYLNTLNTISSSIEIKNNTNVLNGVLNTSGSNMSIKIKENATLFVDGDFILKDSDSLIMEENSMLYVSGNFIVEYAYKETDWSFGSSKPSYSMQNSGVKIDCGSSNVIINGDFNYKGYKYTKGLLTGIIYQSQFNEAHSDKTHPSDARSLIKGIFVVNGDVNFLASDTNNSPTSTAYSNPLLNATFYVDGIFNMKGLWTSGLYDMCRPNFVFARSITQPDVAWGTVFNGGLLGLVRDDWCSSNGYLFMITEDAIDFSELNFASVNIFTPYNLCVNALEGNATDEQWNFTEFISQEDVNVSYTTEDIDSWGLPSILRQGLKKVFVNDNSVGIVENVEGDDF